MRALSFVSVVVFWLGCSDVKETIPPTQIILRVYASDDLRGSAAMLAVDVSAETLEASWNALAHAEVPLSRSTVWPIDIPIVPSASIDVGARRELIASLVDATDTRLAEARVITGFVPRQQRLLEIEIARCDPGAGRAICEQDPACHGEACTTCMAGCSPVPYVPGTELPAFDPDASVPVLPPAFPPSDGGEEDASIDAGEDAGGDAGDGDGEDAGACEAAFRCRDNLFESCDRGKWTVRNTCDFLCSSEAGCHGECLPDDVRCSPVEPLKPEVCTAQGTWETNLQVSPSGACDYVCSQGACAGECSQTPRPSLRCSPENDNLPQSCTDWMWSDLPLCDDLCREGGCVRLPSCSQGLTCQDNVSCCATHVVPGGTFKRSYDGVTETNDTYSAEISPFRLDQFEVTVSRFRKWVAVYDDPASRPAAGAGANPNNPADSGWSTDWNAYLPASSAELRSRMTPPNCTNGTWTNDMIGGENLPVTCVDWYVAFAFCIWDGGRLPTEAEWNFAAAGGDEQRVYPWSQPASSDLVGQEHAVLSEATAPLPVGSKPAGNGRWGHADLAGNVREWVVDYYHAPYASDVCDDCAEFTLEWCRVYRGGAYGFLAQNATASYRDCNSPETPDGKVGFRCARGL